MSIYNTEYRNQARYRRYPFSDAATLTSKEGYELPLDFFLDGMLYPIDLLNGLHVSQIDFNTKTISVADDVTGKIHGKGVWDGASEIVEVFEDGGAARRVGMFVLGAGRLNAAAGGLYTFSAAATELAPASYYPLNQTGVRGILLEDGTLFTGAITLQGQDGVTVDTSVDSEGRSVIRLDIQGLPDAVDPCYDCEMVNCIKIVVSEDSFILGSKCEDNTVCLTTPFELSDVCPPSNVTISTDKKDPCEDPVPCDDITGNPTLDEFTICPIDGRLYILAPSAETYDNPLVVYATEEPGPMPDYKKVVGPQGLSLNERTRILENLFDATALSSGKIKIEYRGLTTGRHY